MDEPGSRTSSVQRPEPDPPIRDLQRRLAESEAALGALRTQIGSYQRIVECLPEGIWTLRADGLIASTNPRGAEMLGYTVVEMLGRSPRDFLCPVEVAPGVEQLPLEQRWGAESGDYRMRHRDGSERWIHASTTPLLDEAGLPAGTLCALSDITARKRVEHELRRTEQEFRAIVETVPGSIVRLDRDMRHLYVNSAAEAVIGLARDEIVGKTLSELGVPGQVAAAREAMARKVFETGQAHTSEYEYRTLDSLQRHEVRNVPVWGPGSEIESVVVVARDVTEQRRAEHELILVLQALDAERARWQATVDSMLDPVAVADAEGRVTFVNRAFTELFGQDVRPGLTLDELSQRGELSAPDGQVIAARDLPLARAVRDCLETRDLELVHFSAGGEHRHVVWNSSPLRGLDGRMQGAVAIGHDITGRRQAEDELRAARDELEQRVRDRTAELARANEELARSNADLERANAGLRYQAHLLANIEEAVIATDEHRRVTSWNPAAERMYGYKEAEAIGRLVGEVIPSQYRDTDRAQAYRALDTTGAWRGENLVPRKDGGWCEVEATVLALRGPDGKVTGFVSVARDVTARRKAEAELRRSEERFRASVETLLEGFSILSAVRDESGHIVDFVYEYINDAGCRLNGWTREQHLGRRLLDLLPQHRSLGIFDEYVRVVETGQPFVRESILYEDVYGGGRRVSRAFDLHAVKLGDGFAVGWSDVTERVLARLLLEQRVEERTRELATLLQATAIVSSTLDQSTLLGLVLDQIRLLVEYDGATIWRVEDSRLHMLAYRESLPGAARESGPLPVLSLDRLSLHRGVIRGRAPVMYDDVQAVISQTEAPGQGDARREWAMPDYTRSWLGVPLSVQDRVIGLLTLRHSEPGRYGPHQAELALAFANQAALALENARLYGQAQELAAVEERQRLARDLHDAVSQTLFAASIIADVLPEVWELDPDDGRRRLLSLRRLTRGAFAEMRSLLLELRPSSLAQLSLPDLLQQLAEATHAHSQVEIETDLEAGIRVPQDVKLALYRIAQEAINNVCKHSGATHARLELCCPAPGALRLGVSDDGQGFDPQNVSAGHLGLRIMRERAALIGAQLAIESSPEHGTCLTVDWSGPR